MMRTKARISISTLGLLTVLWAGCALDFSGDNFQRLRLFFELTRTYASGEASLVHTWFFPGAVNTRKKFVQVSGAATAPAGGSLPNNVTVVARIEDAATGKQQFRVNMKVAIKGDGTFSIAKRLKKNIAADSLLLVTVNPAGNDLEDGTLLALCVDVVEKRGDLRSLPTCAEGSGGATLSAIQADIFTPSCDSFGCHNADSAQAGLVLAAGRSFGELVNVPSTQRPGIDRVEPGDAENSYLVQKLRGDAGIGGERMPPDGPFLSDEELARIIAWINDGAPDN